MNRILQQWSFDLSSVGIFVLLLVAYFTINRNDFKRSRYFIVAMLMAIICFFSPLHILSAQYLFSAHMIVHVLLLLLIGPLLVLSLSPSGNTFSSLFIFLKKNAVIGWLAAVGTMWFWHVPFIFNYSMHTMHDAGLSVLPVVETLTLLMAGILFAAPIIHPNKNFRIEAPQAVLYLFTACIGCSLLGLLITFAPVGTYHHFLAMNDSYGFNQIITQQWHINAVRDQQAAGLIMWVPCCFIYVTGAMYLLMQWLMQKEETIIQLKNA